MHNRPISCLIFLPCLLIALHALAQPRAPKFDVESFDRARVLQAAQQYLKEAPVTITASQSPRSAGGLHDFFSEGDYWWPDPANADAPYIQRDGMTNPDNFTDHRKFLMRLSVQVPALTAAWKLTKDKRFAQHAAKHLRAWFLDEATRMNPHLKFSQAIKGRFTSSSRRRWCIEPAHQLGRRHNLDRPRSQPVDKVAVVEQVSIAGHDDVSQGADRRHHHDRVARISNQHHGLDHADLRPDLREDRGQAELVDDACLELGSADDTLEFEGEVRCQDRLEPPGDQIVNDLACGTNR